MFRDDSDPYYFNQVLMNGFSIEVVSSEEMDLLPILGIQIIFKLLAAWL